MAKECLWYNGEMGQYELLDFDPNGLTKQQIIEKAKQELRKKYSFTDDDIHRAMESLYLLDIDSLDKLRESEGKIPYGYQIVIEGHDEDQMRNLFEEIQNKYSFYDNCVIQEIKKEDTIIDGNRRNETGFLIIKDPVTETKEEE
jgi:hypothetical protein